MRTTITLASMCALLFSGRAGLFNKVELENSHIQGNAETSMGALPTLMTAKVDVDIDRA